MFRQSVSEILGGQNPPPRLWDGSKQPGVRTLAVPHNRESPSIDIHGVKRDLDKKHWCIQYHLTQSSMDARTLNLGDSVFLYTGSFRVKCDNTIFKVQSWNLKEKKSVWVSSCIIYQSHLLVGNLSLKNSKIHNLGVYTRRLQSSHPRLTKSRLWSWCEHHIQ